MMISFRLTGTDLECLEEQQLDSDRNQSGDLSLAVTAKRLLLSNLTTPVDSPVDTQLDTQIDIKAIKAEIKEDILEAINELIQPIKDAIIEDRDKLERLANTVNDIIEKSVSVTPSTPVDTPLDTQLDTKVNTEQINLESKTVNELRRMARKSGIAYTSRINKPQLIAMISERKSETPCHHIP